MIWGWRLCRLRSGKLRPPALRASSNLDCRRLTVEALEDRRLLATAAGLVVDSSAEATSILVQFRDSTRSPYSLAAYLTGNDFGPQWSIAPGIRQVRLAAGVDQATALAAYRADPNVSFAEPDYRVKSAALAPNDPDFEPLQWDMNNTGQTGGIQGADIRLLGAWDETRGNSSMVVAVIDSGVDYDHPDLYQNIWINQGEIPATRKQNLVDADGDGRITFRDLTDAQNQGNFKITDVNDDGRIDAGDILAPMEKDAEGHDTGQGGWADGVDNDGNNYADDLDGYDFPNRDHDPMDDYYHGTHVAGTIAATADNGVGIAGVAPGVQIMPLKFLDDTGNGDTSDAIAALNYAVANGATISNNSWGGGDFSQALLEAIQNASTQGHIYVAAAGNRGADDDLAPFYPANYDVDNVVSVAATDQADNLVWYSNFGRQTVDLAAPGDAIYSTLPTTQTPAMIDEALPPNFGVSSGTSMAAPHVAGAMALVRSLHPNWTAPEVIQQILTTADPLAQLIGKTVSGGRLNVAVAVGGEAIDTLPPFVLKKEPYGPTPGPVDHVRFTFNEPIDPSTFDVNDLVSFEGPSGAIAVLAVTPVDVTNRQFDMTFNPQSTVGDYTLVIGPHITDVAGNELDQNGNRLPGEEGDDNVTVNFTIVSSTLYVSPSVPLAISGFESWGSYLTINDDLPIGDVNVKLNISFARAGNLSIWLVSPWGAKVRLSYKHGGSSKDFNNTLFDDEASKPISAGAAPFSGSYQPDDPLSVLDNHNAQGIWELFVQNVGTMKNHGTLNSWSLNITRSPTAGNCDDINPCIEDDPPVAVNDRLTTKQDTPLTINTSALLANDSDPNDDLLQVLSVGNAAGGSVMLNDGGTIVFTPNAGSVADGSFKYVISDGIQATMGSVVVKVQPYYCLHNDALPWDVNDDTKIILQDAFILINRLNTFGPSPITCGSATAAATGKMYYDVVADNLITNLDAMAVINHLNSVGNKASSLPVGEGEDADAAGAASAHAADNEVAPELPRISAPSAASATPVPALLEMGTQLAPSGRSAPFAAASSSGLLAFDRPFDAAAVDQWLASTDNDALHAELGLLPGRRKTG